MNGPGGITQTEQWELDDALAEFRDRERRAHKHEIETIAKMAEEISTGKKTLKIENLDQAKAFAFYLAKEMNRHKIDVYKIQQDLNRIRDTWGIDIPDPDAEIWVEV